MRRPTPRSAARFSAVASWRRASGLLSAVALLAGACAGDPALEIERRRAAYEATLQSFVVRDDPAPEAAGGLGRTLVLDVGVTWRGTDPLPGLTVDVSMAGPGGEEKAHRRAWIDTSRVDRGGAQIDIELADLPWEPGDGFHVEVRSPVPAAERGAYREFAGAAAGD